MGTESALHLHGLSTGCSTVSVRNLAAQA